ncbi:MAG: Ykof family thiamine-binding protein [Erysipelotrichales bacterium]|nr:Ykof family thiamine-binding protein [Erysipelotrichales bacterium]
MGCRFSLSVMSDDYVNLIINALKKINTENVWSKTDALSTTYRGKRTHVIETLRTCFVNINDFKTHITMEATFSKGCPKDTFTVDKLIKDDLLNCPHKSFNVLAKIAFYPLGIADYMKHIEFALELAKKHEVFKEVSHYATELFGDVNKLFNYLNNLLCYAEENIEHFALQVTMSVNSPTII